MELLVLTCIIVVVYLGLRGEIRAVKPKKRVSKKKDDERGEEYVYLIANPSFANGLFKIGLTTREVNTRMRELFTTGVPTPFIQCAVISTEDCKTLEADLHDKFKEKRVSSRREWFNLTEEDIKQIVDSREYTLKSIDPIAIQNALGAPQRPPRTSR